MFVAAAVLGFLRAGGPPPPYWRDPRIHSPGLGIPFGNVGFPGAVHAILAPAATRAIDRAAYGGRDVRAALLDAHTTPSDEVVDLCCGVGLSTASVGVDTSPQMVEVARRLHANKTFWVGNAEDWGDTNGHDVATIFFALHEMPVHGRAAVLRNALRVARRKVVVADIAQTYDPPASMLPGEPFLRDYLTHVGQEVPAAAARAGWCVASATSNHFPTVDVWVLEPRCVSRYLYFASHTARTRRANP